MNWVWIVGGGVIFLLVFLMIANYVARKRFKETGREVTDDIYPMF